MRRTDHAAEPLLPCGVPELQAHLHPIDVDFFRHEESACGRCGVFWVEFVLRIALEEGGFSDACDI